jgi:hypothetical protein
MSTLPVEPPSPPTPSGRPIPPSESIAAEELAYDEHYHAICSFNGLTPRCSPSCRVCGVAKGWRLLAHAVYGDG